MELVVPIIGILLTAGLLFTAVRTFRHSFPKQQVLYEVTTVPLMTGKALGFEKLSVLYDGTKVELPVLVTVIVASVGTKDIPADRFINGPLELRLGVPILGAVDTPKGHANEDVIVSIDGMNLSIDKVDIPSDFVVQLQYLCDGTPTPTAPHRLRDIDIVSAQELRAKVGALDKSYERSFGRIAVLCGVLFFGSAILGGLIPGWTPSADSGKPGYVLTLMGLAALVLIVIAVPVYAFRQAKTILAVRPAVRFEKRLSETGIRQPLPKENASEASRD